MNTVHSYPPLKSVTNVTRALFFYRPGISVPSPFHDQGLPAVHQELEAYPSADLWKLARNGW